MATTCYSLLSLDVTNVVFHHAKAEEVTNQLDRWLKGQSAVAVLDSPCAEMRKLMYSIFFLLHINFVMWLHDLQEITTKCSQVTSYHLKEKKGNDMDYLIRCFLNQSLPAD